MKPSLRTVLRNFLNHFEDYEARKKLCDDQYEHEFQQLKKLTDQLREDPECTCSWALKDVNRPKNRYKDIVPYDKSRVILPKYDGVPGSDYINASYIKGSSGALAYIAAQGPLPNTVIDFMRMVWVCEVQVIVMACNEKEAGKTKCETYWPNKGEIKHYGNISVELIDTSQVCPDFMVRTLLVKCESEMRDVYQFHYTSWPDHGVPETVHPMLELVRLMRDCQASETVPIVVHCSAGCGRTGTICAVDYVWACLRHGKLSEDFSLFQIALELRRQRIAMIQTKEQYMLAHKAVATLFEQQLNVIDCHIYVNLDEDGEPLMWKELSKNKFGLIKKENLYSKDLPSLNKDAATEKEKPRINSQSEASVTKLVKEEPSQKTSSISDIKSTASNLLHDSMSSSEPVINENSGSSLSQNSCLSQNSSEDTIPFIDDDEISVRPNCGRAYLNMPSSGSFSKIINRFDPFADQVVLDDSSPDGDPGSFAQKIAGIQSTKNINGDQSSVSSSRQDISSENSDQVFPNNYATLPCGSSINKNFGKTGTRESYPPSRNRYDDSVSDIVEEGSNTKGSKKVGKATVVRRPSISKLKALFEKSGMSSNKSCEVGKRSLFRNNSHNVSRAGSAPPSLNCMDKTSAVEKESILMLVTRKFRSSSVRTEREVCSKSYDKSQCRKSSSGSIMNLREGFATLSRTVSFNLSKTLRSYSPSKTREKSSVSESGSISFIDEGTSSSNNKQKLPDIQPKGKSTWYDKSSLPRAVAVVKPTEKLSPTPDVSNPDVPKSPTAKLCTDKSSLPSVIPKPPKLLPFFNSLSKPNGKDTSTMWYNEVDESLSHVEPTTKSIPITDTDTKSFSKSHNIKVLPFIHSITPWKKSVSKSPLLSPESPKNFEETIPETPSAISNSKFYTNIENSTDELKLPIKNLREETGSCPVPEEIIPLNTITKESNSTHKETFGESLKTLNETSEQSKDNPVLVQDKNVAVAKEAVDVPPAIPKKMVIGKQKQFENQIFFNEHEVLPIADGNVLDNTTVTIKRKDSGIKPQIEGKIESPSLSPKDHYINVTPKTLKNIEQIENTVCNNPRGAIIDLTSRESYCMEEELDNALKQLSETSESKSVTKINSKFPGYEVIWPEEKYTTENPAQELDSKSKLKFHQQKETIDVASKHCKTGLCYSPPLRRSMNTQLGLAKCRSCSNIDWLEPNENVSIVENSKEPNTTPTKKLVNEAVDELNSLLDRLTTRTLNEDPDLESKHKQIVKTAGAEDNVLQSKWPGSDNLMTHSVTILSKTNISDSSSKEEEIVFHFPPPPPLPPPEEDQPTETFNIVRKNGTIKVAADKEGTKEKTEPVYANDRSSSTTSSVSSSEDSMQMVPQPIPRKSKQSGLRKSASYTNICVPQSKNKGYENVFLEKYQTLSRLQIEPKNENLNQSLNVQSKDSTKPLSSNKPQILKPKPDYVNVRELHISSSPKLSRKSPKRDLNRECVSVLKMSEEMRNPSDVYNVSKEPFTKFDLSKSCPPSELKIYSNQPAESDDKYSTYGKISKIADKQLALSEKRPQDRQSINLSLDKLSDETKKKPTPSKKAERAPLPPNITNIIETKEIFTSKDLPKKLPSRKLEKAPLPPPLLQKSFTAGNIAKKNMPNATHYANFPPYRTHISEESPVLPAVHENISNDLPASALSAKLPRTEMKSHHSPNMGRGLSHSQSDVSVFLALKERRMQPPVNKGLKAFGENQLLARKVLKHKKEFVSVSSSDSDSSYERIFFDKPPEQMAKSISRQVNTEQINNSSPRSYRKEMPVAPPRSKRRNTTEIHYAKVKSKDASPFANASAASQNQQKQISELLRKVCSISEPPPAIPLKTKDAFEVPDEFGIKGNDKVEDNRSDYSTSSDVKR